MKNHITLKTLVIHIFFTFLSSCKDENHIEKYNVNIDSLKTLPDNFYAYRRGSLFIDNNKFMIWFNLDSFGNIESVYKINDIIDHKNINQINIVRKYKIDTIACKANAQKFIDLSKKYKFGHININKKNKIAFSHKDGLPEQYVKTFNDSLKNVYIKNKDFVLLKNGWFENVEK